MPRIRGLLARRLAHAGAALILLVSACGGRSVRVEADDDEMTEPGDNGDGSLGGRGGSSRDNGGVSMMGGRPPGGAAPIGGTVPAGGSAPAGGVGGGGDQSDPDCRGARTHLVCILEGKQCENVPCGLADSGVRQCTCATSWQCTACDYTDSPFRDRPARIPTCPAEAADEAYCHEANTVCGPIGGVEQYCACHQHLAYGLVWDCNSPPSTWR